MNSVLLSAICLVSSTYTSSSGESAETRSTLEVETVREAWGEPGLRAGLGYVFTGLAGLEETPGGLVHSLLLRVGLRLDEEWLLFATFMYGLSSSSRSVLRYAGSIEPTFVVFSGFTVAVGVGVAGLRVSEAFEPPEPEGGVSASYTLPSTRPLLGGCDGLGAFAAIRVQYEFPVSRSLAMGPSFAIDGQWTGCAQSLDRSNVDSGQTLELRQYWPSVGVSAGWTILFR